MLLAGYLCHMGAYNKSFKCVEANQSYATIEKQAKRTVGSLDARAGSLWHKITGASITREALDQ